MALKYCYPELVAGLYVHIVALCKKNMVYFPGPLSTKQELVMSRSREIGCYNDGITMTFNRYLGSASPEVPVKFQSDWNPPASRLRGILR